MVPVTVGTPQQHDGLTLFPLFPAEARPGDAWTLLPDALEAETLRITEIGDGVVGELLVANQGPAPVLILDGEQLIGAKQNRTTNRTILVAATSETPIPVSCMEQGRWRHQGRFMKHGGDYAPSKLRKHARRVEAREAHRPRGSDEGEEARPRRQPGPSELLSMAQGEVWHTIRDSSHRAGVVSATGALDEVYAGRRERLSERERRFPAAPGQVGLLAFVDGRPAGLDVLPADVYPKVHERLVRAYVFEAMDAEAERLELEGLDRGDDAPRPPASPDADAFLAAVRSARRHPMATAGLGTYAALAGDVVGGELVVAGDTVHLCAFPAD
jgi:hypothetical protein